MKKFLLLLLLFCTLPAFAQFTATSRGPLSGRCNGPALGLDTVNTVVYACSTNGSVWTLVGPGGGGGGSGPAGLEGQPQIHGSTSVFVGSSAYLDVTPFSQTETDPCQGISSAIATLPASGGVIDARGLTTAQLATPCANTLTIPANVAVLGPVGTLSLLGSPGIQLNASGGSAFIGAGGCGLNTNTCSTILDYSNGTGTAIDTGGCAGCTVTAFKLNLGSSTSAVLKGINAFGGYEGRYTSHIYITGGGPSTISLDSTGDEVNFVESGTAYFQDIRIDQFINIGLYDHHEIGSFYTNMQIFAVENNTAALDVVVDSGSSGANFTNITTGLGKHGFIFRYTETTQGTDPYNLFPNYWVCNTCIADTTTGGDAILFDSTLNNTSTGGPYPIQATMNAIWGGGAGKNSSQACVTAHSAGIHISGGAGITFGAGQPIRTNCGDGFLIDGNAQDIIIDGLTVNSNNFEGDTSTLYESNIVVANGNPGIHISDLQCGNVIDANGNSAFCFAAIGGGSFADFTAHHGDATNSVCSAAAGAVGTTTLNAGGTGYAVGDTGTIVLSTTAIINSAVVSGGSNYAVGDLFSVGGSGSGAVGRVIAVSSGTVLSYKLTSGGSGYTVVSPVSTTPITGIGSGLTINVMSVGTSGAVASYTVNTVGAGGAVVTYTINPKGAGYVVANGLVTATGGPQPGLGTGFLINITAITSPPTWCPVNTPFYFSGTGTPGEIQDIIDRSSGAQGNVTFPNQISLGSPGNTFGENPLGNPIWSPEPPYYSMTFDLPTEQWNWNIPNGSGSSEAAVKISGQGVLGANLGLHVIGGIVTDNLTCTGVVTGCGSGGSGSVIPSPQYQVAGYPTTGSVATVQGISGITTDSSMNNQTVAGTQTAAQFVANGVTCPAGTPCSGFYFLPYGNPWNPITGGVELFSQASGTDFGIGLPNDPGSIGQVPYIKSQTTSSGIVLSVLDWETFPSLSNVVYNNVTNMYTAGATQIFVGNSTTVGINIAGLTVDPGTLNEGDLWSRSDLFRMSWYDGAKVQRFSELSDLDFTKAPTTGGQRSMLASLDTLFYNSSNPNSIAVDGDSIYAGIATGGGPTITVITDRLREQLQLRGNAGSGYVGTCTSFAESCQKSTWPPGATWVPNTGGSTTMTNEFNGTGSPFGIATQDVYNGTPGNTADGGTITCSDCTDIYGLFEGISSAGTITCTIDGATPAPCNAPITLTTGSGTPSLISVHAAYSTLPASHTFTWSVATGTDHFGGAFVTTNRQGVRVFNVAIGSSTAAEIHAAHSGANTALFQAEVALAAPYTVIIGSTGINECVAGTTPATYRTNLHNLYEDWITAQPTATIIFAGGPDASTCTTYPESAYREQMAEEALVDGVPFVDVFNTYSPYTAVRTMCNGGTCYQSGIEPHLNQAAGAAVADFMILPLLAQGVESHPNGMTFNLMNHGGVESCSISGINSPTLYYGSVRTAAGCVTASTTNAAAGLPEFPCEYNCAGTSGSGPALVGVLGNQSVMFDSSTVTYGHWVETSQATNGEYTDTGSATFPSNPSSGCLYVAGQVTLVPASLPGVGKIDMSGAQRICAGGGTSLITSVVPPIHVVAGAASLLNTAGANVTGVPDVQYSPSDTTVALTTGMSTGCIGSPVAIATPSAATHYKCTFDVSQTTAAVTCGTQAQLQVQLNWVSNFTGASLSVPSFMRLSSSNTWSTAGAINMISTTSAQDWIDMSQTSIYDAASSPVTWCPYLQVAPASCGIYPTYKVAVKCVQQ